MGRPQRSLRIVQQQENTNELAQNNEDGAYRINRRGDLDDLRRMPQLA
jgi:hypothetical protein